jgi:hypothetical protein
MMDNKRIAEIIEELAVVQLAKKLNVSNDVLFAEACSFHRGELASKRYASPEVKTSNNHFDKPLDSPLNKGEAYKLIKEFKEK